MRYTNFQTSKPISAVSTAAVAAGLAAAAAFLPHTGGAAEPHQVTAAAVSNVSAAPTANVTDAFGQVQRQTLADKAWKPVSVGDNLTEQTTLHTGDNAACLLRLAGGHVLRVGANTTVLLRQLGGGNQYSFKVLGGQVWSMVRKANHPARYEVETPSAVAGVTGTIFSVAADPVTGDTTVSTEEGSVRVRQGTVSTPAAVTRGNFLRVGFAPNFGAPFHASLQPLPQDERVRHMWSLLRSEGILVRAHEIGAPGYRQSYRMQRRIEPDLFLDWRRSRFPMAPRPRRQIPSLFGGGNGLLTPAVPLRRQPGFRPQRGNRVIGGPLGDTPAPQ